MDLISRKAAIDALISESRIVDGHYIEYERIINEDDAIEAISMLPSAEPKIIHCGECAFAEVADPEDGGDGMSDLIRRTDVLETYADLYWADERINAFKDDLDKVFEELRCLPSVQQWIPVGEELPIKRGFYLITTEKTHDVDICSWNGSRFESYPNGCLVVLRPLAWMPLPEPWKGEENDK